MREPFPSKDLDEPQRSTVEVFEAKKTMHLFLAGKETVFHKALYHKPLSKW